jgi:hypothetical protein
MKEKDIKKIESVEQLARLTQLEFLEVGGRMDRLEKKTDEGFKSLVDVLDLIRADVHDMKIALGPLTRTPADLEESVRYLDKRVTRLEKAGRLIRPDD